MPINKNTIDTATDIRIAYGSTGVPMIHQRKPSMMPTIGLSDYNSLYFSGTIVLLNPTGDI